jgi:hypothetical protein
LFFILNAYVEAKWVNLPPLGSGLAWHRAIDTSLMSGEDFVEPGREIPVDPSDHYIANARSTVVLVAKKPALARPSAVIELSEEQAVERLR